MGSDLDEHCWAYDYMRWAKRTKSEAALLKAAACCW